MFSRASHRFANLGGSGLYEVVPEHLLPAFSLGPAAPGLNIYLNRSHSDKATRFNESA